MADGNNTINKIAARINHFISNIPGECEKCKKIYSKYEGKCENYSWDIGFWGTDPKGRWEFSLERHGKEIWTTSAVGEVDDILLKALEGLNKGNWK